MKLDGPWFVTKTDILKPSIYSVTEYITLAKTQFERHD